MPADDRDAETPNRGTRVLGLIRSNLPAVGAAGVGLAVFVAVMGLVAGPETGVAIGFGVGLAAIGAGLVVQRWWRGPFTDRMPLGQVISSGLVGFIAVLVLVQVVPYGRSHSNPPVVAEPSWDSPRTRELAVAACYDCHSNEVEYPWYSNVAPFSWAVQRHVDEGRHALNFSQWGTGHQEADEAAETIQEGSMPPFYYTIAHPGARLSDAEKRELAAGLNASLGRR